MAAIHPPHPRAFVRAILELLLAALLCGGTTTLAHAGTHHVGFELGLRGLFGAGEMSDLAKPSFGEDLALTFVSDDGGFGVRAMGGMHALASENMNLGPSIYGGTENAEFNTSQDLYWFALGPTWTFPHGGSRTEVYLLLGTAKASVSGSEKWIDVGGVVPVNDRTSMVVVGAMWTPSQKGHRVSFEFGGELMMGGSGTFYDSPPAEPDGAGGYVSRTSEATIQGAVLRLGLSFHKKQPKHQP